MKKRVLAGALLSAGLTVQSAEVSDNFDRENTAQSRDSALIGEEWKQDSAENQWLVKGLMLHGRNCETRAVLYNSQAKIDSAGFALNLDVAAKEPSVWAGVVFNYQDMNNFLVLRFKGEASTYQLLACVDGEWDVLQSSVMDGFFAEDCFYTLTVSSDDNRLFSFSIKEPRAAEALAEGAVSVDDDRFKEGFAGVYFDMGTLGHNAKFDNFKFGSR